MTEPQDAVVGATPEAVTVASALPPAATATFDPGRFAGVSAILVRELRGRMRGKRAFIFLTVYLGFLALLLWLALRTIADIPGLTALQSIAIGRGIFIGTILIETLVVVALAPAYTAGAISSEREKQTYDLLAVTPISSLAIVGGKLLSGLSYLALVVGASFPIACLAFAFGGIGPEDLIRAYLVLAVTGIGVGAIGIWCSAAMKRTQPATVGAFIITAMLVVGASAAWVGLDSRDFEKNPERPPIALLYFNPFVAQMDVICQATGDGCIAQQAEMPRNPDALFVGGGAVVGPVGGPAFDGQPFVMQPIPPGGDFWPRSVLVFLIIGVIGIFAAAQSISPTRRWHWNRRSVVAPPPVPVPEVPADD